VVAFAEKLAVRRRSVRGTFLLAGSVVTYLSVLVL